MYYVFLEVYSKFKNKRIFYQNTIDMKQKIVILKFTVELKINKYEKYFFIIY